MGNSSQRLQRAKENWLKYTMFDLDRVISRRKNSVNFIKDSKFYNFIQDDLIERLSYTDRHFTRILIIESLGDNILLDKMQEKFPDSEIFCSSIESLLGKKPPPYDLIISCFFLHWISDIQAFLSDIRSLLSKNGLFMANFPGSGSLRTLRKKIIELEMKEGMVHTPHISPLISLDQITNLLQSVDYKELIVDHELLELEFDSPIELMHAIKSSGHGNALINSKPFYSINRDIYRALMKQEKSFIDQINLISFIAGLEKNSIKLKNEYYTK